MIVRAHVIRSLPDRIEVGDCTRRAWVFVVVVLAGLWPLAAQAADGGLSVTPARQVGEPQPVTLFNGTDQPMPLRVAARTLTQGPDGALAYEKSDDVTVSGGPARLTLRPGQRATYDLEPGADGYGALVATVDADADVSKALVSLVLPDTGHARHQLLARGHADDQGLAVSVGNTGDNHVTSPGIGGSLTLDGDHLTLAPSPVLPGATVRLQVDDSTDVAGRHEGETVTGIAALDDGTSRRVRFVIPAGVLEPQRPEIQATFVPATEGGRATLYVLATLLVVTCLALVRQHRRYHTKET